MSSCRSCGATIIWMRTNKNARMMPVDFFETELGRIQPTHFDPKTMTSHFATCPNADQHRKPRC